MILKYLALLLGKELRVIRNAYFSTPRRALTSLGALLLLGLLVFAVTRGVTIGMEQVLAEIPPAMEEMVISLLLVIIFIWLAAIIFISVVVDSPRRFFQTADLELLMATPTPPALVFSFRFLVFILGSSSTLMQLFVFGFGPLLALGTVVGAPWHFFLFILPVAYLFLIIPAAIGVLLIMLLLFVFTPRIIFRIAGFFQLALTVIWIVFVTGDQEAMLTALLERIGQVDWLWNLLRPLQVGGEVVSTLLGYEGALLRPFLELFLFAAGIMALAIFIIRRLYYPVYDRLQSLAPVKKKARPGKKKAPQVEGPVLTQWKMALRNQEMAGASLGMGSFLLVYYLIMYSMDIEGTILPFFLNVGVVSFVLQLIAFILLMPASLIKDAQVLRKQFWLLKVAPVSGREALLNSWQAHFWPQAVLGIPALALAHFLTGLNWSLLLPAILLYLLLQGAVTLLNIAAWYAEYAWGSSVSPLVQVIREWAPMLFYPLFLIFLGLGYFYQRLGFLSFLHAWEQGSVFLLGGTLALLLLGGCLLLAWKKGIHYWEEMEI